MLAALDGRPACGRASALALTEALPAIDRLTDEAVLRLDLEDAVRLTWDHLHVVPVDQRCLDRAAGLAREQPVRLTSAIHLAAAERMPRAGALRHVRPRPDRRRPRPRPRRRLGLSDRRPRRGAATVRGHPVAHWATAPRCTGSNADVEVHKVVVGPYDNNVFVVRCRRTGDAVLIDAANEHEQLLELCQRLGVRRVLETHGHWDHIQAVPAIREAGYEVAVTELDAPKLKDVGYDVFLDDAEVIEVGELRLDAIHNPGHTPGSISFHVRGTPLLFTGDTLFPGGPGNTTFEDGDFADDHPLDRDPPVHVPRHDVVLPGHGVDTTIGAERPPSTSGSPAAGEPDAAAMRYDERPVDDTPVHTADLPATPIRDRNIPATAWVEAPAELLALGADLPGHAGRRVQAAHRAVAAVAGRPGVRRRRPLLGRAGRRPGDALHAPPLPRRSAPRAPARAAPSTTASGPGRKTSATTS